VARLERLGPEGYSPQVSERVYATLAEQAIAAVRGGHSAIVDAVYARPKDRLHIERAAADASVPFVGLWLDAPDSTLMARTDQRTADPSDADAGVVRMQRAQQTGTITWHRLDAAPDAARVLQSGTAYVRGRVPGALNASRAAS
jgi:uncharacterized protein